MIPRRGRAGASLGRVLAVMLPVMLAVGCAQPGPQPGAQSPPPQEQEPQSQPAAARDEPVAPAAEDREATAKATPAEDAAQEPSPSASNGSTPPQGDKAAAQAAPRPYVTGPIPDALPKAFAEATPSNPMRPELKPDADASSPPRRPKGPPKLSTLTLPPGFSVELYTRKVPHARSLAVGGKGIVYVSTRQSDKVYAVVDHDGDHRVDRVYTVAKGLDTPNGIAYRDGDLYVAEVTRILRFANLDERLQNPPRPIVVNEALPAQRGHEWRYIRFGPDDWLYLPIGAPCNACLRQRPIFASITRLRPDGSGLEIFAHGVRNSVGFDWHPTTGELWFTDNGRDRLGNDIPPDELNRAPSKGLHFGFPHCHGGVILDPELAKGRSCTEFEPPVQNLGPHVAALGMRFYTGTMFPERYRNAVILAEHGSWNREEKIGYRVMVVPIKDNLSQGYEPLIEGFLDPATGEVWGRPVDVAVLDDGSLLVSDDWQGAVYRVTYQPPE